MIDDLVFSQSVGQKAKTKLSISGTIGQEAEATTLRMQKEKD